MRLFSIIVAVLFSLAFAGCQNGATASDGQSLPIPDATTSITAGDLRIAPMDTLNVQVFGVSELDGTYQVDFEGKLKMPLVGEVPAVGLTARQLAGELEKRYEETYLQSPDVNVTISDSQGRRITLDGSVAAPGLYPVTGQLTLLQAVALAGGPTQAANPKNVVVFRQINAQRHSAAFNLVAIRKGEAEDPPVYGNDIIVVDGSEARRNYGELLRSLPLIAFFTAF